MTALDARSRKKVVDLEVELAGRGLGFNACEAAREAAKFRPVRRLIDARRFDGVDRNVDGKGARDGVNCLSRIHEQHALTLPDALDVDLSVRSPQHAGYQG